MRMLVMRALLKAGEMKQCTPQRDMWHASDRCHLTGRDILGAMGLMCHHSGVVLPVCATCD